jgi:hypothetical protein
MEFSRAKEILDREEHSEEYSEESVEPMQLEVENSVLGAFIDISYREQQGFHDDK